MTADHCQLSGTRRALIALLLAGWTVALRLPLINDPIDVSPDGCEYIGIARHLVEDGRWLSSIKWHFFTQEPVVHVALADRPPLYPLWAALWIGRGSIEAQIYRVRLANVGLAAAVAAASFWFLCRLFPSLVAAGSALLFASYPAFVRTSAQPLTEPLFLLLLIGAFHAFMARPPRPFLAGALSGLAYLTRPAGLLLPLALGVAALMGRETGTEEVNRWGGEQVREPETSRRSPVHLFTSSPPHLFSRRLRSAAWLLAGFALICLPYWMAVWKQYGSPFYSVLSYNFSIGHIYEGMYYGFERRFTSPMEFVRAHPRLVAHLVWAQTVNLAATMGRSLRFLWPLVLFLGWEGVRRHGLLLGFAGLNFLFHALSWTVWGAARYQFPAYLFLAPVLLEAPIRRLEPKRWGWLGTGIAGVALAAALVACAAGDARLLQEKRSPEAGVRLGWAFREAARWVSAQPWPAPGVCAANYPAILNLLTRRPALVLPRFRDTAQARRFLQRYHPGALILAVDETAEAEAGDVLLERPWQARRVRPALAPWLEVAVVETRARGATVPGREATGKYPAQWLLILRARGERQATVEQDKEGITAAWSMPPWNSNSFRSFH